MFSNFFLSKESFSLFLRGENINQHYLLNDKLCLYSSSIKNLFKDKNHHQINIIYLAINLLFISIIIQFIAAPSIYLLIMIFLKIFPETCFIYIYYNQLKIKFPKIDILIYSIINPFYSVVEIYRYRGSWESLRIKKSLN